ncbi:phosphate signaling complex protein PhoU [Myxococcus sp. CA051A]|uniref:Phosphate-specific transport system accessory protein PhoU n=1 Tax=Myxococcus llanfairpwllgwyngyllgogerychwyrndrobwllllantysiliogogogochensis TaxID=2590453 RepID=A0A540WPD2_9BACT|nr:MULTISPECIES: phosphate signaling complex protein PhoU [Myxococcus]NTX08501.1 phosphate signaling complex protein PhoU [Myxococcus sp. CA040A]NTX16776.1 phosphate signaling complex protein PhoU [Myxococcus sp. CA056]NTX41236.1 phosphate signaling complex protein PhoU [Myxococcus sp. CA033]NTX53788.1 phosphate signaling complex protein PhoU [Myxococcus sp. CA039A]NTX67004.1 phosphate signaling complex protein PhoU [Myxococcus sp. CA051A]
MALTHTDKAFEQDLRDLREKLLAMGAKVEGLIVQSMRALTDRDSALAEKVVAADKDVNRLEVEIDELCRRILALRQPAASDLRLITTALKIVTDLERIGDLAVNIAERSMDLNQVPPLAPYVDTPKLAELAQQQVKRSLDAFVSGDVAKAEVVLQGDDLLDALFLKIFNELLAYMMEDSKNIRRATALMFIAKHLERIGDHAMNVAEMVVYMVRGKDIRHPRSRNLGD